jgi:hypothetical protein
MKPFTPTTYVNIQFTNPMFYYYIIPYVPVIARIPAATPAIEQTNV